jgi:hypothetical protein
MPVLFFKLEEEENPALLLHLLKVVAETVDFGSVTWMGCWRVVGFAQGSFSSWLDLRLKFQI